MPGKAETREGEGMNRIEITTGPGFVATSDDGGLNWKLIDYPYTFDQLKNMVATKPIGTYFKLRRMGLARRVVEHMNSLKEKSE